MLREEFAKLHAECNALLEGVKKDGRDFTAEEKAQQDKRFARMDAIKAQIEQERKLAEFAALKEAAAKNAEQQITGSSDTTSRAKEEIERRNRGQEINFSADARKAINGWMRGMGSPANFNRPEVPDDFKFTLTTGSDASVMLPKGVMAPYLVRRNINAFRKALALTGFLALETPNTQQISLPVWDDTSNVGQSLAESATTNDTADSTLTGSVTLNATLYESECKWFSNTLISAEGFDILAYVAPVLQKMLDKGQEAAYTTTAQGVAWQANYTVTNGQTGITYSDLLNWEHKLVPAYRSDGVFILSDSLYRALRGMVDNNGRPIIDLDPAGVIFDNGGKPQSAFVEKIHGFPIVVSDYMTAITTGIAAAGTEKCGLFVSGEAIKLRDVVPQRLTRYVNVPTFPDQTGYNLFANGDCKFIAAGGALFIY